MPVPVERKISGSIIRPGERLRSLIRRPIESGQPGEFDEDQQNPQKSELTSKRH